MATVLLLSKAFPPVLGGVETYSREVARAYHRAGCRVIVVTQAGDVPRWRQRKLVQDNIEVIDVGSGRQVVVFLKMLFVSYMVSRRHQIDVTHATTWRVGLVPALLFRKVPNVVTVHGREVLIYPRALGWLMRRILISASLVITVSDQTQLAAKSNSSLRRGAFNWVTSFNGLSDWVDSGEVTLKAGDGKIHILSLCRLVPRKNVRTAVRALSLLDANCQSRIVMRIAGSGPELEAIRKDIQSLGLDHVVSLLGYVPQSEVQALYDWADIYIHPHSHASDEGEFEGFGIAIADAMARGCAVVSGRAGGPLDFVIDGETGMLVDGADATDVARVLGSLIGDPELRSRLAGRGQTFAIQSFSWDRHVAPTLRILKDSMEEFS